MAETVDIKLRAEDAFSETFKKYNSELKDADKGTKDLDKTQRDNKKTTGDLAGGVAKLAAAYITVNTAMKAYDLAKLSAQNERTTESFRKMASVYSQDSEKMMKDMRSATGGMISDLTLQQSAMKSMVAGLNGEQIVGVMEYVSQYAASVGMDVSQAMETTMTGLARGSAQFLDDVGIQVIGSKDVVGDALKQMSENMVLFNDNSQTAANRLATFEENANRVKIAVGDQLSPVMVSVTGIFSDMAVGVTEAEDSLSGVNTVARGIGATFMGVVSVVDIAAKYIQMSFARTMAVASTLADAAVGIIANTTGVFDKYLGQIPIVGDGIGAINKGMQALKSTTGEFSESARNSADLIKNELVDSVELWGTRIDGVWNSTVKKSESVASEVKKNLRTIGSGDPAGAGDGGATSEEQKKLARSSAKEMDKIREYDYQSAKFYWERKRELEKNDADWQAGAKDRMAETTATLAENREAMLESERMARDELIGNAGMIAGAFAQMSQARISMVNAQYRNEADKIKKSNMSEKQKEKALDQLDKKREEQETKAQKRLAVFSAMQSVSMMLTSQMAAATAAVNTLRDTVGGPIVKIAAASTVAAFAAGIIAPITSAGMQLKSLSGREFGGNVMAGSVYRAGERGPEMYQQGNDLFMIPSANGKVTSNNSVNNSYGGASYNFVFNVGAGATVDVEQVVSVLPMALETITRNGTMDWSRVGV